MAEVVLDSSVLLAAVRGEVQVDDLLPILEGAVVSAVIWCEIHTKLHDFALTQTQKTQDILSLLSRVEPFTSHRARLAADLRQRTCKAGLSLADRTCLALEIELDADVYTADRAWTTLDLPCSIHLIR